MVLLLSDFLIPKIVSASKYMSAKGAVLWKTNAILQNLSVLIR